MVLATGVKTFMIGRFFEARLTTAPNRVRIARWCGDVAKSQSACSYANVSIVWPRDASTFAASRRAFSSRNCTARSASRVATLRYASRARVGSGVLAFGVASTELLSMARHSLSLQVDPPSIDRFNSQKMGGKFQLLRTNRSQPLTLSRTPLPFMCKSTTQRRSQHAAMASGLESVQQPHATLRST
jgi:hypothetical protein